MKYLDNINSPQDLKKLNVYELKILCQEIREFMLKTVSKTGGHLASNLGVVELTIALHYIYDMTKDKLIWDVGHQSYVHKIITGRKDQMLSLRQFKGLSGFPKRCESIYDVFDTGHSSTSISAAVGMARGRDLKKEKHEIIAVIGDGALTGGMAFEALNDLGRSNTKAIIILNDNEMSISPNVGGLSSYLRAIRTEPKYLETKKDVEKILDSLPVGGKELKSLIRKAKNGIKQMVVTGMLFEELGLTYMGPIDGHNIAELLEAFNKAKYIDGPLLIHIATVKGKGYKYAENMPGKFHGISSFCVETGECLNNSSALSYSDVFGNKLCKIAEKNNKVVAITAAMTDGTGLTGFSKRFPDRLFDVGIAEQHAVTMAAGLSASNMIPVVALYSSFLQRAYDQVIHDVALQNLHVIFAVDRAGIVGNDGETHQGLFDSAFLSIVPNMTIMAPADYRELENMLEFAVDFNGPIALRYPRGTDKDILVNSDLSIELGKGIIVQEGSDLTIISHGKMVKNSLEAAKILNSHNIHAEILNLRFLKPLDENLILNSVNKTKRAVIVDEATSEGTVSLKIKSIIPGCINTLVITFPDKFIEQGSIDDLINEYGFNGESIAEHIIKHFEFNKQ